MSTARNRIAQLILSTGTGSLTLGGAIAKYQALGAGDDGDSFDILITDGNNWEVARDCAYTHATTTLTRGTLEESSTGAAINLTSAARVYVTATAARYQTLVDHAASTANPHAVTAAQVGADAAGTAAAAITAHDTTSAHAGIVAAQTTAASSKATPVDADELPLADSAASYALKKLTWANLKATLAGTFAAIGNWVEEDVNVVARRNGANAQTIRNYTTYTDSSNYERLSLTGAAGSNVEIKAETAGTGGDNLNVKITPTGQGMLVTGGSSSVRAVDITGKLRASFLEVNYSSNIALTARAAPANFGIPGVLRIEDMNLNYTPGTINGNARGIQTLGIYVDGGTGVNNYIESNLGLGTDVPTAKLDINANSIRLRTSKTPASAAATGNQGDICWDADYLYVCTATDTWKRAALSTW